MTGVTRDNIGQYVQNRLIQVKMANGAWWDVRPNGAVRRWKRDPLRIEVPVKMGIRNYTTITGDDFDENGYLSGIHFRVKTMGNLS